MWKVPIIILHIKRSRKIGGQGSYNQTRKIVEAEPLRNGVIHPFHTVLQTEKDVQYDQCNGSMISYKG